MNSPPPLEISAADAAELRRRDAGALLLDCRTPEEHVTAKIDGALLIPMQELPDKLDLLETWRDRTIIVHCHHGVRSLRVAGWLREHGFPAATSMRGGIEAWSAEVDPGVPRY